MPEIFVLAWLPRKEDIVNVGAAAFLFVYEVSGRVSTEVRAGDAERRRDLCACDVGIWARP